MPPASARQPASAANGSRPGRAVCPASRRVGRLAGAAVGAVLAVTLAVASAAGAPSGPTSLSDPAVTPTAAAPGATITFEVTYRNREGSPPDFVRVVIDGAAHDMTATGGDDWRRGVRHRYAAVLPSGDHTIAFVARGRDKFSDEVDGGVVSVSSPATPRPPTPRPSTSPTAAPVPPGGATPRPTVRPSDGPTSRPTRSTDPTATGSPRTAEPAPDGRSAASISPEIDPPPSPGPPAENLADRDLPPAAGGGDPGPGQAGAGPGGSITGGPGSSGRGNGGLGAFAAGIVRLGFSAGPWTDLPAQAVLATTSGALSATYAAFIFGRRRRNAEPPTADAVLAAAAAAGLGVAASSTLLPDMRLPSGAVLAGPDPEAHMPRWRRPSLLEARKTDPLRDRGAPPPKLSFEHGLVEPVGDLERRPIRYTVVDLLDRPDELLGTPLGCLAQGDEIQVLETQGVYRFVLCPDGRRGWVHRMTLGDPIGAPAPPAIDARRPTAIHAGDDGAIDADVMAAFLAARARA